MMASSAARTRKPEPAAEPHLSPVSISVERSTLGIIFLRDTAYYELIAIGLRYELFTLDQHRAIFRAMVAIVDAGGQPSIVAVVNQLEKQKDLSRIGGEEFVAGLIDGVAESDKLDQYVEILREKYLRRQSILMAKTLMECAADPSEEIRSNISRMQDDLYELQGGVTRAGYDICEYDSDVLAKIKEQMYSEQEIVGLPFGIRELDESTTGIRDGEFIPVGGYPGCVAAETRIGEIPIAERSDQVLSTLFGHARPSNPFLKGQADLYEVLTRSGSRVVVTLRHRFLTPTGWCRLSSLHAGALIAGDGTQHGGIESGRLPDFLDYCSSDLRRRDELRNPAQVAYLGKWQQLHRTVFDICGTEVRLPIPSLCEIEGDHRAFWDEIVSIKFVRHGQFYDISVPSYEHYSTEGLWHHNSGKTGFACTIMRENAIRNTAVGFFSLEMTKEQLLHRLWAQSSDIPYSMLRNPKTLPRPDLMHLETKVIPQVRKLPIAIDDRAKNIAEIIPRAHLWVRRKKIKLIIVDYLQKVHAPGKTEYEIVSHTADALTEFAKDTGVPIVALSQLTRAEDKKNAANAVPTIQMLRSSGKIEQNAHLVVFTHRPEDEKGDPTGEDMIVIGKQRAGTRGRIKAYFNGVSQRWEDRKPQ
jgi:replicative DNA helicase